jgi:ATP-dependent DNA helicase DinG
LELPPGIAGGDICLLQNRRSGVSLSKFKSHIDDTHNADIIITTHALSLIDALLWGRIVVDGGDTPIRIGIFDEADRLVDAADGLTGVRIRLTETDAPKDVAATAQGLIEANNGDGVEIDLAKADHCSFVDLIDIHKDEIEGADVWLEAAKEEGVLHATVDPSPTSRFPAITALALFPARVLSRLWSKSRCMRSVIFTSATLGRDFETEIKALNIQRDISFSIEPKHFGKLSFMLSDDNAPDPMVVEGGAHQANLDYLKHVSDTIKQAHEEGGRCLTLVPSYNDVEGLAPLLVDRGLSVLLHRRGEGLAPLIDAYKLKDDAVLISPSAWEGIDLPGLIDHLVIGRVPFSPPDSAREAVMGPQVWRSVIRGMRRLKQGIGRALRRPDDVAKVWITDPRFPLPTTLTRDPLKRVYSSRGVASLAGAIPKRFKAGALAPYNRAGIIKTSMTEAT